MPVIKPLRTLKPETKWCQGTLQESQDGSLGCDDPQTRWSKYQEIHRKGLFKKMGLER